MFRYLAISDASGLLVAALGAVVRVNVMLGFEVSLKIRLLGSSVLLERIGKVKATTVTSLSVCAVDGTIGVNLVEMFVQHQRRAELHLASRHLASETSADYD